MHQRRSTYADEGPRAATAREIAALGPWFHNLERDGVATAPDQFLGDYSRRFFSMFSHAVPDDLTGRSVLDIRCNAGFFSFAMWRRAASSVLGVDAVPRYLAHARHAAEVLGAPVGRLPALPRTLVQPDTGAR